jgi:hypothetical protein
VRRLSQERVGELAEEIWTASSGDLLLARPVLDPRSSRAGASAQAAFVRRPAQERQDWGEDRVWLAWWVLAAAPATGLLLRGIVGAAGLAGCPADGGTGLGAAAVPSLS